MAKAAHAYIGLCERGIPTYLDRHHLQGGIIILSPRQHDVLAVCQMALSPHVEPERLPRFSADRNRQQRSPTPRTSPKEIAYAHWSAIKSLFSPDCRPCIRGPPQPNSYCKWPRRRQIESSYHLTGYQCPPCVPMWLTLPRAPRAKSRNIPPVAAMPTALAPLLPMKTA